MQEWKKYPTVDADQGKSWKVVFNFKFHKWKLLVIKEITSGWKKNRKHSLQENVQRERSI